LIKYMSLLFETIKVKDGAVQNIRYHNDRFNLSRRNLFNIDQTVYLEEIIKVSADYSAGVCKCKVVYDSSIRSISFSRYIIKPVNRLITVECNDIDYGYKYSDRSRLEELITQADCSFDEEILIIKNGLITDTSYSNVALFDGKDWITPSTPLLSGTRRANLLERKIVREGEIRIIDLKYFEKIKLFNAMLDFDECPVLPTMNIERI